MAQGGLKKAAAPQKKKTNHKQVKMKKGARTIAPKQAVLVKQRTIQKKLTAQINKNIERQMSVKANAVGKLTIMKKLADEAAAEDSKKKKKK
ncbi:uncharacterized protein BYT42DRAFT_572194 [Radiomyces spectabilis]|uniref:uncharacterized protein n=1 Tax=Radiomyces spectabilis TaxID=64574 RepID=UPI00221F3583|nr:uncharacterized protein BYT42DRAFT_572194 [Radiomyces spectabilis]KAI8377920.1 hypothetical protein BYT42DRAFT_572194 [Radiomyces spectabilis]